MILFSMSDPKVSAEETGVQPLVFLSDEPTKDYGADGLKMLSYAKVVAGAAIGTPGPFTIGVFGKWGEGKSSVLRQARSLICTSKTPNPTNEGKTRAICVWFNAWQYDHEPYPIVPLALTIAEGVDSAIPESNKHKDASRWITLREIGAALRALASGLTLKTPFVDIDVKEILSAVDRSVSASEGETLRPGLYQKAFGLLQAASAAEPDGSTRPPIVVFIDDLDRCMPQHALRLLQSIRLVLSQPGFIFVLALDRDPVVHYLTREYEKLGMDNPEANGRSYLDKMVQLPLWLPPHKERFAGFINSLLQSDELKQHTQVREAVGKLVELLTTGTEANPRAVVRLINSLIADKFLWSARGKTVNTQWLGFCAISRVLRDRLGDADYRNLVSNSQLCDRLAKGESMGETVEMRLREYEVAGLEHFLRAQQVEKKLLEHILGLPVVQALLDTELGRAWLMDSPARQEIEAYLAPEQRKGGEAAEDGAKAIDRAIRKSLGLDANKQITRTMMKHVTSLDLSFKPVTDSDLLELENLPLLTSLNLSGTQVTDAGLEHLKGLTSLTDLDLGSEQFTDAGLERLKGLTSLTTLGLWGEQFTDAGLEYLNGLTSLTSLYLMSEQFTNAGLERLKGLTSLMTLALWGEQFTDAGLEYLKGLTSLTSLYLGGAQFTDAGLEHLKGLTSLTSLYLMSEKFTDAGLEHLKGLTSLESLDLSGTQVTDAGLEHLKGLTSLESLDLSGTQVTDAGKEDLKHACPNITIHS